MTATLRVEKLKEGQFRVTVSDARSHSSHVVTVTKDYYEKLTAEKVSPEELVRVSFEFLLQREPKESILRAFDLTVIREYFPEYEGQITSQLHSP